MDAAYLTHSLHPQSPQLLCPRSCHTKPIVSASSLQTASPLTLAPFPLLLLSLVASGSQRSGTGQGEVDTKRVETRKWWQFP